MNLQLIALTAAPITAICALAYGIYLSRKVLAAPVGSAKIAEIGAAIESGAMAYLSSQFKIITIFVAVLAGIIYLFLSPGIAATFLLGAVFSGLIGYFGMLIAVKANTRTANAAQIGLNAALQVSFGAGTVNGMLVVGLGLLGASAIYIVSYFLKISQGDAAVTKLATDVLVGYGFGAALLALFMRVGGGIFTKAADVGADLVGKVCQLPERVDHRQDGYPADNGCDQQYDGKLQENGP